MPADWISSSDRGLEVTGYEACAAAFQSPDFVVGIEELMRRMGVEASPGKSLTSSHGAEHASLRRIVSPWFTPRRVSELRRETAALVEPLVAGFDSGDDFMTVTKQVPGVVFCWMMGAPVEWGSRLFDLSGVLLQVFGGGAVDQAAVGEAMIELGGLVSELITSKEADPGDDLTSLLLAARDNGVIDPFDVHSLAFELLSASTDNTAQSAGLVMALLAADAGAWQQLRHDRSLVPGAIEEALRLEPRVRTEMLTNAEPASLLGVDIPAKSLLFLDLVSAHHDPAVYVDPDRFDVTRRHPRPQLNFGLGAHYCLGAALARMELDVLVSSAVTAWSAIEAAADPVIVRTDTGAVDELRLNYLPN